MQFIYRKMSGPAMLVLMFFILLSFVGAQTEDAGVISVDSSIVVMNAVVTDAAGQAVRGLGMKHFKVFEEGQEQSIKQFEAEETPFAAVILLDTSGSMEERVTLARSAAIQFLDGLRAGDSAAIYSFHSKVELVQDFSNSRDIAERIFDLKSNGMTVLNDAVYNAARLLSNRPEKRRAIIVLSDGADTLSSKSSDKAMRAALLAGATIYTVDMAAIDTGGRDRMQNQGVLKNFAEKTGGKFVATPGGVALRDAFKRIVEELGVQYTIAYEPSNLKRDGKWRAVELKVSKPNLTIRTRKGYNAPKGP
ncbi:MAG TPA: VWA domain-containing protein [Pyrinomonadaceae bacterium]|nr:VWA domain-containing protein [Pyrinomonadaceae bacterium]